MSFDDPLLKNSPEHVAASVVEQANQGNYMPTGTIRHENFARAEKEFLLEVHRKAWLNRAKYVCILSLVALPFFEVPIWCQGRLPYPCGDPNEYELSGLPYIERWQSLLIETVCLVMLTFSVALQYDHMGSSFWKHGPSEDTEQQRPKLNTPLICKVVLLTALFTSAATSAAGVAQALQASMYLRVLVPVVFTSPTIYNLSAVTNPTNNAHYPCRDQTPGALRVRFRIAISILHTFADIAVLLGLFILVSAYIATLIFRQNAIAEFEDYPTALLNLFVLLTTANNPNVWADAYTADRRAFFFFFVYLVVGLFFLMNLVTSVMNSNYKAQVENEDQKRIVARQQCLREAFRQLDTLNQTWIDRATVTAFLHEMKISSEIPDIADEVFLALGYSGDFSLRQDEFESLCNVVAMVIEDHDHGRAEEIPTEVKIFTEPVHDQLIWFFTLASVVVAVCETEITSSSSKNKLAIAEIVLGCVYVADVLTRVGSHAWTKYWRKSLNQFDFLFAVLTTIIQTAVYLHLTEQHWVSILFLVRGIRVCYFTTFVPRWHLMAQTVIHSIPATAPILAFQFTVCTLFSLLGVQLCGGKLFKSNLLLEDTEYANGHLYAFNYNDYASAMVTSFNLCIVNNWYVIMDAYAVVTATPWSRVFFVCFWAVAVACTLQVVVTFSVENFLSTMEKAAERGRTDTSTSTSPVFPHYNFSSRQV